MKIETHNGKLLDATLADHDRQRGQYLGRGAKGHTYYQGKPTDGYDRYVWQFLADGTPNGWMCGMSVWPTFEKAIGVVKGDG